MKLEGTHGGRMIGSVLSRNLVPDGDYTPTQERTMEHNRRQGARSDPQEKTNVFFFSSSCSAGSSISLQKPNRLAKSLSVKQLASIDCPSVCVCADINKYWAPTEFEITIIPCYKLKPPTTTERVALFFYIQRQQKKRGGRLSVKIK